MKSPENIDQLISFYRLRQLIGWLGIILPVSLIAYTLVQGDCNVVQDSISSYYHTSAGHIFVAITFSMAIVLITYRGYDNDYVLFRIAAALSLIVAFVSNLQVDELGGCFIRQNFSEVSNMIHLVAAISFFALLAYICIFRFTKSKPGKTMSYQKKMRNNIYKCCGLIMIVVMLILALYMTGVISFLDPINPIFTGETIMLFAFGAAWLTKGQLMLKDK